MICNLEWFSLHLPLHPNYKFELHGFSLYLLIENSSMIVKDGITIRPVTKMEFEEGDVTAKKSQWEY